jgi:hypothetical protein
MGSTQGDKNDRTPAPKATSSERFSEPKNETPADLEWRANNDEADPNTCLG